MIKTKAKELFQVVVNAGKGFAEDECMKMSAALAYYTVFSIGPMILILTWALGFFYGNLLQGDIEAQSEVMDELTGLFGADIANMLQSTAAQISDDSNQSKLGIVIGVVMLAFTSTTIFVDIQRSINEIWNVKPKPKKGWVKMIVNRLLSFSMIIGLAFLLMVSLVLSSVIGVVTNFLDDYITLSVANINLIDWINTGITFIVISTLFGCIYAVLPDAKVRFKDIVGGAVFTALMFMIGKWAISLYLSTNATASAFGAAGSIIILLSWVCYSSAILYFGAEFTKAYAMMYGNGIQPTTYAVVIKHEEYEYDPETGEHEKIEKVHEDETEPPLPPQKEE